MPAPGTFRFYRDAVAKLARDPDLQKALHPTARQVQEAVQAQSPRAVVEVEEVTTELASTRRAGYRVSDVGENAVRREFGNGRSAGRRAFGRITGYRGRST